MATADMMGSATVAEACATEHISPKKHSTVQYSNCGRGSQTSALASEPQAHEGAQRAQ
jgi:hypothetical protein